MFGEWPLVVFASSKKVLLQSRREELELAELDSITRRTRMRIVGDGKIPFWKFFMKTLRGGWGWKAFAIFYGMT